MHRVDFTLPSSVLNAFCACVCSVIQYSDHYTRYGCLHNGHGPDRRHSVISLFENTEATIVRPKTLPSGKF